MRENERNGPRVLMTADSIGGVWAYCLELAAALAPHEVQIRLATMGAPLTREQRRDLYRHPNVTLFESTYKLEWMEAPWDEVEAAGEWLLDLAAEFRPDLVHLNGYAHGSLPWGAPTLVVGHSCVCSWWNAVRGEEAPAGWDRYRKAVAEGLASADLVVAPTRAMLRALERHYGPLPRTKVIPNCRDPEWFRPARKEPFVFAAGRLWDEAKNIQALAAVAGELPWPVFVAGETRHPEGGATDFRGVYALGSLGPGEVQRYFARAGIYALPARYEPFGLSALEAGLAGCALVLGDIESLREVWGDAAVYVPPDDRGALCRAVTELATRSSRRQALAEAAYARARSYTPGTAAASYLNEYRRLLSRGTAFDEEERSCAS